MKIFLSHARNDQEFACRIGYHLKRSGAEVFSFVEHQRGTHFVNEINAHWPGSDVIIFLRGERVGDGGLHELKLIQSEQQTNRVHRICIQVLLPSADSTSEVTNVLSGILFVEETATQCNEGEAIRIARSIAGRLDLRWVSDDGLPFNPHLFDYEKDIIRFYRSCESITNGSENESAVAAAGTGDRERWLDEIKVKLLGGCPPSWPVVEILNPRTPISAGDPLRRVERKIENLIGGFRNDASYFNTTCLFSSTGVANGPCETELKFPEAGPRREWRFPRKGNRLRVAIVVSGGIAPGINAVIDGIVQRHELYARLTGHEVRIYGLRNGFRAFEGGMELFDTRLVGGENRDIGDHKGTVVNSAQHTHEGGSIIGTSRAENWIGVEPRQEELERADQRLYNNEIDILYVIGGDGSMKAAHALWSIASKKAQRFPNRKRKEGLPLSVVAVPKTMDNDILWVWQSFGFMSAVEKARETIETLATEVASNPRIGVVQLFGSDSGFIVSHAVLASSSGHCVLALIPEVEFSMKHIVSYLFCQLTNAGGKLPHCLIVMAETAIPTDAMEFIAKHEKLVLSPDEREAIEKYCQDRAAKKRIQGQTDDHLRTAGLKIVSQGIQLELQYHHKTLPILGEHLKHLGLGSSKVELRKESELVEWSRLRVLTNEPRHLVRAIPPSCQDIIMCQRLGALAVDNAIAGYTDFMISQWLTEYVLVPLRLVTLGRKHVHKDGIFWKSVLAKTGQPSVLTDPVLSETPAS